MQYRAPDRSLLEIAGDIDYSAPAIQVLYSPVTGTPITLPSLMEGSILPRRWRIVRVIENPPADAPSWSVTVQRLGGDVGNLEDQDPTPLPSAMSAFIANVKSKFGGYGVSLALIAGAALAAYLFFNRKEK